jgi:hypothetical protein
MPLLSALEDFIQRSLSALPSTWERLVFVSELREGQANYRHWGLEQKFGEVNARGAIAEAHSNLIEEMTSARLSELWTEARQAAESKACIPSEYLNGLVKSEDAVPQDLKGVPPEHFAFVVTNLYRVARFHSAPSHLAA